MLAQKDECGRLIAASGYPGSIRFRRILEYLLTPLEAKVCTQIIWAPVPSDQIAATINANVDTVKKTLDSLHIKGLIYPRDFKTGEGYRYRLSSGKLHKSTLLNPNLGDYPELAKLWSDFIQHEESEWQCVSRLRATKQEQPPQRRILPSWKALTASPDRDQIEPWEDQRAIAASTELCVEIPCPCRVQIAGSDNKCDRTQMDACLLFDREAEYSLSKGIGRRIDKDELLAIMEQASVEGLAGSYTNNRDMPASTLCYCCDCCCHLWVAMNQHDISQKHRGWAKSRWQPEIDVDICNGCGICAGKCPWQAMEMKDVGGTTVAVLNADKCWGCAGCALWCEPNAIKMRCVKTTEWVPEKLPRLHPPDKWTPPRIVGETLQAYLD